jgi:hypothetical protein
MSSRGDKDMIAAFGVLMAILAVWSYCDGHKQKKHGSKSSRELNAKLDRILAKLGE